MNKKGSLELSMNSIVIIILAVVFVSLVLVFMQTIFQEQETKLLTIVSDFPDIDPPTKDSPLKVRPKSVIIEKSGQEFFDINYFHPRDEEYCQVTVDGHKTIGDKLIFTLVNDPQKLSFGKGIAAKVIMTVNENYDKTGPQPSMFVKVCCASIVAGATKPTDLTDDEGNCKSSDKQNSVPLEITIKR